MAFTSKQKEVIKKMRDGWFGETSVLNNESAYLATDTKRGKKINIKIFKSLEERNLVNRIKKNFALHQFHLTEFGKHIEL